MSTAKKWEGLDAEFARIVTALVKLGMPHLPPRCGRYRTGDVEVRRVWDDSFKRRTPKHPMAAVWFAPRMSVKVKTVADGVDKETGERVEGGVMIAYQVSPSSRVESEVFWPLDAWAKSRWLGVVLKRGEKLPPEVRPVVERFIRLAKAKA